MFKNYILCLILVLFGHEKLIKGMEISPDNSWEYAQTKGPLKLLNFEESEAPDLEGRHFGWLFIEEKNDYTFVAVTLYPEGYCIDFIEPLYKFSLPNGMYYWRYSQEITSPPVDYTYKVIKTGDWLRVEPTIEYDISNTQNTNFHHGLARLFLNKKRDQRYRFLPSLDKAFNNNCSPVYLYKKFNSPKINAEVNTILKEDGMYYRDMSEKTKQRLLALLPLEVYNLLKSWLEVKLSKSGLENRPYNSKNSEEYVMNKQRIIDQFIIEEIVRFINLFNDSMIDEIDIYQILETIHNLKPCNALEREENDKDLIQTYGSWDAFRIVSITGIGLIQCNAGLLQHD